jgi:uncharacterized Ntn-hydrolase superfamily protein
MTLSIVAKDSITGAFGVCGYTDIAGYGSLVPHVSLNGAVATQAYVNVDNGLKMMELLDINQDSNKSGNIIINEDPDKEMRQMIAISKNKRYFHWTGKNTIDWKGFLVGNNFVIAGNCMKSKNVLQAAADYYSTNITQDFVIRLIKTIQAGENVGGHIEKIQIRNKNNKTTITKTTKEVFGNVMSAAVIIASSKPEIWHNLRIDAHKNAILELENIYYQTFESAEKLNVFYNGAIKVKPIYWRRIFKI